VEETVFRWATGRRVLSIGVPMGLQFSITAIGSMMLQASNNALGTTCMAAFTTAMRIKMFLMCMLENMGVAMATYCGQNFGAGERRRIVIGVRDAWFIVVGYSLAVLVIVWPVTYEMGALFVSEAEGADTAGVLRGIVQFLHSSIPFYPVLGTLCVLRYSIQGMGHTKLAMLSGVSEMIARTAVSLWAVPVWGYTAVCFGDPTAWLAAVGFLVPAFWFTLRRSFPRQSLPHTRRIPVAASE
jgi:Na+-driven multidrug efflux pump